MTCRYGSTAAIALATMLVVGCSRPSRESLTVVSWGGAYAQAVRKGYIEPFVAETGVEVRLEDYNGGLAQVRAQVEAGNVHWDVVDFEISDAVSGCDEGLLEPIDATALPSASDGTPAVDDFLPDTLLDCSVGTLFYSTVYAYNAERIPGGKPATIDDFFDLERFPGRRGMRRTPLVNLEFALIAAGVPVSEVYTTLDTSAGVDRAFRKLDTIKEQVVWWEAGAQPPQMLADGEVVMSTAYNGRIFNAQVIESQPFVIVWDGQVLDTGQLGIVAGTRNLETALEFVRFATTAESTAAVSGRIAYSPVRRSVKLEGANGNVELVRHIVESGVPVMGHLGLIPQSVHQLGGFKVQARDEEEAAALMEQALALERAGCFALVLEAVPATVGAEVTGALEIPTIGIGAGTPCRITYSGGERVPQHELLACAQCGCFAFSCFEDFAIRARSCRCDSMATSQVWIWS